MTGLSVLRKPAFTPSPEDLENERRLAEIYDKIANTNKRKMGIHS